MNKVKIIVAGLVGVLVTLGRLVYALGFWTFVGFVFIPGIVCKMFREEIRYYATAIGGWPPDEDYEPLKRVKSDHHEMFY